MDFIRNFLGKYFPKFMADLYYLIKFKRRINWHNPTEFNEKIRWMQFNIDTSKWSLLADKYRVREYLKKRGHDKYLPDLYGVWSDVDDIDFSKLPNKFVIKTNHGYGDVIVVKDKSKVNIDNICKKMDSYLKTPFGYKTIEPHYLKIKPLVIIEELLENSSNVSSSIIDYKFYCFYGNPIICGVFYDRDSTDHKTNSTFYDMSWNRHDEYKKVELRRNTKDIPKPINLDIMIDICKNLTSEFPFVRLDMYESLGKVYIGEFTFTPAALSGGSINPLIFNEWGKMINVNK